MDETLTVLQETLENRQVALTVSVAQPRVEEAMQRTARKISQRGRIHGFRPGKAPYQTVLRAYGREAMLEEAAEDLAEPVFAEALQQANLQPFGRPNLAEMKTEPMTFKFIVPLPPLAELGDYKALRLPWQAPAVDDQQVDGDIEKIRRRQGEWQPVEQAAAYGDLVSLDIIGKVGEETLLDQREWDHILTDAGSGFIPGFDAAYVGKAAGEEWDFELKYPEDSTSRWKGQTAQFHAKVLTVKHRDEPALDDDFAKKVSSYQTLAELKQKMRESLERQALGSAEEKYTDKVLDKLVEGAHIEYPPMMVEDHLKEMMDDQDHHLRDRGSSLQAFLQVNKKTEAEYREELRPEAEKRLRRGLALGELTDLEGIQVNDVDVDAEIETRASALAPETASAWRQAMQTGDNKRLVGNNLLTRRSLERLRAIARGEVTTEALPVPAEEALPVVSEAPPATPEPAQEVAPVAEEPVATPAETTPDVSSAEPQG